MPSRRPSGRASACSAAPPPTSPSPRRSSTRCAPSARSATTSSPRTGRSLQTRGTVTDDVEHVPGGKTFFWAGEYSDNLNERETHVTDLNVFETFEPKLSQAAQDCDVLFLANIQPDLQLGVREQCGRRGSSRWTR